MKETDIAITNALSSVRNDDSETNWLVAGHQTLDPEVVSLVGSGSASFSFNILSGSGGYEEMIKSFDQTKVQYGLQLFD
jgi:hypothetical protein